MASNENIIPKTSGYCVLCSSVASLACHRCGDFYCTKKCQLKDWQSHRYICFSIPPLVRPMECSVFCDDNTMPTPETPEVSIVAAGGKCISAPADTDIRAEAAKSCIAVNVNAHLVAQKAKAAAIILNGERNENEKRTNKNVTIDKVAAAAEQHTVNNNEVPIKKTLMNLHAIRPAHVDMPLKNSVVYVVGFRSPNRCFIRDASGIADKAHSDICEKVHLLGMKQPAMHKTITSGFALAKHNGLFHRVKVLAKKNFVTRLHFIDLGFLTARNGAEMREISVELLQLPCYILEVQIRGISNYALNEEITKFLKQFIDGKFILSFVSNWNVELLRVENRTSMNELIREFCSNMQLFELNGKNTEDNQKSKNVNVKDEVSVDLCQKTVNSQTEKGNAISDILKNLQHLLDQNESADVKHEKLAEYLDLLESKKISETKPKPNVSPNNATEEDQSNLVQSTKNYDVAEKNMNIKAITPNAFPETKVQNNVKEYNPNATSNAAPEKQTVFKTTVEPPVQAPVPKTVLPAIVSQTANANNILSKPSGEPVLTSPFELKRLSSKPKEGLDLFIVDNSNISRGIFGAFDKSYAADFSEVHTRLSEFKDAQPYTPVVKEYVIAKFKSGWHRAKVVDIKQDQSEIHYNVMHLDFTNVGTVTVQDIRRYPADLTVSCHTNVCLLEGFPHNPSKAQINFLEDKLKMHSLLHIDSVNYFHDMAFVRCKTLIDELNAII